MPSRCVEIIVVLFYLTFALTCGRFTRIRLLRRGLELELGELVCYYSALGLGLGVL